MQCNCTLETRIILLTYVAPINSVTFFKINKQIKDRKKGPGVDAIEEGGQKTQTSSYEVNTSWGRNVQCGDYSYYYCMVYFKIAQRVDLKSSHCKKKM